MNKLLLTLSTVSLLFAANVQTAHAEGIGGWFKGIFSNEESIDSDAITHDERGVGHKVMEGPYDDNKENYTPDEDEPVSKTKETHGPDNIADEITNAEEDDELNEPAPIEDNSSHRI